MSTQTRKTHRPMHTTAIIGVVAASMLALTALLTGCQQKPDPEPPPAVVLPDVDTTKVHIVWGNPAGTTVIGSAAGYEAYRTDVDAYNAEVEADPDADSGKPPRFGYIVGAEGGKPDLGALDVVGVIAPDPGATGSGTVATSQVTQQASYRVAAATDGLPAADAEEFAKGYQAALQDWLDRNRPGVIAAASTGKTGQIQPTVDRMAAQNRFIPISGAGSNARAAAVWGDATPEEVLAVQIASGAYDDIFFAPSPYLNYGIAVSFTADGYLYVAIYTEPAAQAATDPPAWYTPPAADTETPASDDGPESGSSTTPGPAADDGETVPIDPIGVVNPGDIIEGDAGKALDGSIGWDPEVPIDLTDLPDVPVSVTIENPIVIGDDTFLVIVPPAQGDTDVPDAKDPDAGADGPSWADAVELIPPADGTDPVIGTEPVTPPSWAVTVDVSDLYWQAVTAAVQRAYDEGGYQSALDAIAAIKGFLGNVVDEAVAGSRLGEVEAAANADKAAAEAAAAAVNNPGNTGGGASGGNTSGGTSGGGGTGDGTSGGGGTGNTGNTGKPPDDGTPSGQNDLGNPQ